MSTQIYIQTRFEAQHRWVDAPEDVVFLRNWHRHVFHVKLGMPVKHDNRDIEFFQLKRLLDDYLESGHPVLATKQFELSCEHIASLVLCRFRGIYCEVSEDGENGAVVVRSVMPTMQKSRMFIGQELEGPSRGERVLFVPDGIGHAAMAETIGKKAAGLHRVYLGAGNRRLRTVDNPLILEALVQAQQHNLKVDIEFLGVSPALALLEKLAVNHLSPVLGHVILMGLRPEDYAKVQVKSLADHLMFKQVQDETISWYNRAFNTKWETWLHHPDFDQDQDV